MESMETDTMPSPVKQAGRSGPTNNLHVWYFGSKAIHRTTLEGINFNEVTLSKLKELALERKPDGLPATTIDDIDVLYNGRVLLAENPDETPLESLRVKENTVVHVVKKIGKDGRQAKYDQFQNEPPKPVPKSTVSELAIALKTMILSPNFFNAIDRLSDPQTLKNVLAVVPNLRHDPVGLAVIQDPAMILYLADDENLNMLATSRPWVVEALNFIAAGIHQHESSTGGRAAPSLASSRTPGLHSLLSYMRQIEDEDDDDRPEGGLGGALAGSSQRRQITREQLSSALEAFQNLSRGAANPLLSTLAGPSGNRPAAGPATPRMPTDPLGMAASLARSASQAAGANTSPLSGDMVARAVRDAINQLPPDQRAAQIDAFRSLAMQLGNASGGTPAATPTPAPTPPAAQPQPQNPAAGAGSGSSQYSEQLAQMREMGIFDERLSLMALRVSEGDVATAVELIFSGWQGEGLD